MLKRSLIEKNKRPGVRYALTQDDIELPVVDMTHPAFALSINDTEQRMLVENFLREGRPFDRLPKLLRNLLFRFLLRGAILADGVRQAQGTFMTGMHTYLLKLGPEMLGDAYAKPIDRRIAAGLPALGVRLRLQDIAHLTVDVLAPALCVGVRSPLCFVNIAGGPAIDSLNALILLNKEHPGLLADRPITINVLDLDEAGPAFGEAALAALSEMGGPLHGARIVFRHIHYNWAKLTGLNAVLEEAHANGALVICSSEGGLFEYGSDNEIKANLTALRGCTEVLAVIGSVTRADELTRRIYEMSGAATYRRGLPAFRNLIQETGWDVTRAIERPFSDQVILS